jgi:hypothetical protein
MVLGADDAEALTRADAAAAAVTDALGEPARHRVLSLGIDRVGVRCVDGGD